jgi:hypothetical protein
VGRSCWFLYLTFVVRWEGVVFIHYAILPIYLFPEWKWDRSMWMIELGLSCLMSFCVDLVFIFYLDLRCSCEQCSYVFLPSFFFLCFLWIQFIGGEVVS